MTSDNSQPNTSSVPLLILMLLLIALPPTLALSQKKKLYPSDRVPRTRLMTDEELLAHLDTSNYPATLRPALTALAKGNTSDAILLFVRHLKDRPSPRYFFDQQTMPQRAARYAKSHPEDKSYGENAARNHMRQYGTNVDWQVPGKDLDGTAHTPNTVRFLARHLYAENFAILSLLTNDPSYAQFQVDQHKDFLADVAAGKAERGGNDVFERFYGGHRIRNLMMFHQMLLHSPALTDDDHILLIKSFFLHGAIIIEKCSSFNWGNHQLVGLCALFEMTAMYPEFPVMREWNERVWTLILEHLQKEVKIDGFQFERASHYFKLDIYNYFRTFQLAEAQSRPVPAWALERFRNMFSAIVAVLMPNGSMPPLQDAQDTYIGNRNIDDARKTLGVSETSNSAELVDPSEKPFMTLGAVLFHDGRFKTFGGKQIHPAFSWFLPEHADSIFASLRPEMPSFTSTALGASGYYVMRSGWEKEATYMVIDGGLAAFKPDHTHGGVLGVIAHANGSMVLPNYRVRYSDPTYPFFKNSYVKNVALVDSVVQGRGWIPNAARTGFGKWSWLPTPTVHRWIAGSGTDYFSASHNAFDTLGISYTRSILYIKPSVWLFVDSFTGSSKPHTYKQLWQGTYRAGEREWTSENGLLAIRTGNANDLESSQTTNHGTSALVLSTIESGPFHFITAVSASPEKVRFADVHASGCTFEMSGVKTTVVLGNRQSSGGFSFSGEAVVRQHTGGQLTFISAIHTHRLETDGLTLEAPGPVSYELRRTPKGLWEGAMTEATEHDLTVRLPDGVTLTIRPTDQHSFLIR